MLRTLREGSKTWVMKAILGFLALTFVAFFGVSTGGGGFVVNPNTMIEVGDVNYGVNEIQSQFNQLTNFYAQQLGQRANIDLAMQRQIMTQSIDAIVVQGLFAQGANDLGLTATDTMVAQQIRSEPSFQAGGQFNRVAFNNYLLQTGQQEADVLNGVRSALVLQEQYFGSILAGIQAPPALTDYLYRYRSEERSAGALLVELANQRGVATTANNAELEQFYEGHRENFRTPDMRRATILWVTVAGLAEDIVIDEETVAQAYEDRKDEFTDPEQRVLAQAIAPDRASAQEIFDQVADGADFADAVDYVLGRPASDLGSVVDTDLLPAQAIPAFDTEIGGLSAPFETALGWHVIHVVSAQGGIVPTLDDIRAELTQSLAIQEAGEALFEYADLVDDAIGGGANLDEAATQSGLTVENLDPMTIQGLDIDGAPIENLPSDPGALSAMFSTDLGQISQLEQTAEGGFFFVQVEEILPSRIPDFSEIGDKVTADWERDQKMILARAQAEQIVTRLDGGAAADEINRAFGIEMFDIPAFSRTNGASGLPGQLVADIFAADEGDVVSLEFGEGILVARVTEIFLPEGEDSHAAREAISAQLEAVMIQELQAQFANALRDEIDVSIDNAGIDTAFFSQ